MVSDPLEDLLPQLGQRLSAQMGLHFPPERWPDLERAIRAAAVELGFNDFQSCIHELVRAPVTKQQIEILASHLTVGETYFFRDKVGFGILEETVLPELIQARRGHEQRLRIWSAGCCTGEEPYSIAILLRQMLPDLADWQISIMATDINTRFLQKAAAGIYSEWSFRDAPAFLKRQYFTRLQNGKMALLPEILKMVQFSCLNLAEDVFPALLNGTNALDLIVCRNVLMYFSPEQTGKTLRKFHRALVEGGWLAIGAAEASPAALAEFKRPVPGIAGFFQKRTIPQSNQPHQSATVVRGGALRGDPSGGIPTPAAGKLPAPTGQQRLHWIGQISHRLVWCPANPMMMRWICINRAGIQKLPSS